MKLRIGGRCFARDSRLDDRLFDRVGDGNGRVRVRYGNRLSDRWSRLLECRIGRFAAG